MGDKALALRHYAPLGLVLNPPYVPIGHDVCNTYTIFLLVSAPYEETENPIFLSFYHFSGSWCMLVGYTIYQHNLPTLGSSLITITFCHVNTCIHVYIHVCDFTQQFTKIQTIPRDKFAEWLYICIYYIMYV